MACWIAGAMFALALAMALSLPSHPAPPRPVGGPVSLRAHGSGRLRLQQVWPLRDLIYTTDGTGRGLLSFEAGSGFFVLSGPSADRLGPSHYLLHLDALQVMSLRHVRGDCDLELSADARGDQSLDCRGRIEENGEAFRVVWRGSGAPAVPVR